MGTATLATSGNSAGIWNVGTLPDYRKNGVGKALAATAILEAKHKKLENVMAILMPKGMAWNLFLELGFKEACQFPFYVYGVDPNEIE